MSYRFPLFLLFIVLFTKASAQLDVIHWLPPVMTDTTNTSVSNSRDHFVVITTPSAALVPYTIKGGDGVVIQSGTVSNSTPVNFQIARHTGDSVTPPVIGDVVPTVAGATDHHVGVDELNQINTEGIVVEADAPVYVNVRQRSRSQGASMTSKGCAALGTEFRVGTMRNLLSTGQESRNDFFSIMATEDNTMITIDEIKPGMIFTGRTDNSPINITLNQFESYTVGIHHPLYPGSADVNDIDGTRVTADKAITLVSGTYLGSPADTFARDAGFDQPGPVSRAGTQYILLLGEGGANSVLESPQVIATQPNTNIFLNSSLTPINPVPLQPGEYLYLDGNFAPNGTMFIESNEPVVVHQTTAGSTDPATTGFSYIPPLTFDVTNVVDNIAEVEQIGAATLRIVTTAGSTVSVNGGPTLTGALAIAGTTDWIAYTVPNAMGNASVVSTGPVAVSLLNLNVPVGAAGYFSGFPDFKALIEVVSTSDCFPDIELVAIDPSGSLIRTFEWFNADGTTTGVMGANFTPPSVGGYFVRSTLGATAPCEVEDSAIFNVVDCPVSDLRIEKSVPQVVAEAGDVVTFTIAVTNDGPDPAGDVNIEDILPSGYSYVAASITGGDVNSDLSPSGSGLRWLFNSIAVGATETVTFDATVLATGDYPNTATVTTTSVDEDLTNNTSTAQILQSFPGIATTKSVDPIIDNLDGTFTAVFTVTVTNTGNEPFANLQIVDSLSAAPNNFPAGTTGMVTGGNLTGSATYDGAIDANLLSGTDIIPVGEDRSVIFTVIFTPDRTGSFQNQATASGEGEISGTPLTDLSDDPAAPGDEDPTTVTPILISEVMVAKTAGTPVSNGDGTFTAPFTITIENTGNEVLNNVALFEDVSNFPAGATFITTPAVPTTLSVGQSEVITVEVTFVPDPTGPYTNSATVDATSELSDILVTATDTADTPALTFAPGLSFMKTGPPVPVDNGDGTFTTNFTLALENTGDVPLINVQITDSLAAFPSITNLLVTPTSATANPAFDGVADTNVLAAGFSLPVGGTETVTLSFSFVPDSAGPFVNTASGTGDGEFGGGGVNTPDTAEVTPALSSMLGITKTETGTVSNGDGTFTSSFTIVVSNTGNEIVNDVTAVDPLTGFPSGAVLGGDPLPVNAVFAVGQMETYNVTVTFTPDSAGPFPNVAEVTGTGDSSGDPAEEDSGTPTESTPTFTPALAFEKTGAALVDNGDGTFTTNFTLALENTGDVPLINVQITDSLAAFPSITNLLVTPTSATANPAFDGVADTNVLAAGFSLPVGGTETVTLSFSFVPDSAGPFVNTASGTGDGEFGGGGVNTPDTAEVTPALSSMLGITKTETGTVSNADGTFTSSFTIVVSNTGNEIVNDVTAVDPLTGFPSGAVLGGDPLPVNAVFAVGQMETYNVTVTFTPDSAGPFPNVAEVTGTGDSSGDPAEEDSGTPTESTPTFTPALAFEKTGAALVDNGDGTFTTNFTLALENTGDVPLINVQITDSLAAFPSITNLLVTPTSATANPAFDGVADTNVLAAGFSLPVGGTETVTLSFSFVPDSAGPFVNTASGTGDGEFGGGGVNTPSSAEVTPALSSMLGITKTETGTVSNADGTFTSSFTIVVSNTGNEIVNDVTAVDPLTGFPSGAVLGGDPLPVNAVFAVGQMETYNVTVTFTPDSAGPFPNVAEVTGTGDSSGDPAEEDSGTPTESTPTFTPALAFEKTGAALVDNGDGTFTTNFTLALENTGDVPLINVQITDSLAAFPSITNLLVTPTSATANPAFDGVADTNVLAAGFSLPVGGTETVTLSFSFVPDSAGPFVNTASGTGDGEFGGGGVNTPSSAEVTPALSSMLGITKTETGTVSNADGTFTSSFTIVVSNTGNEIVNDVTAVDPLTGFPSGAVLGGDPLPVNAVFAVGQMETYNVTVTFTPDSAGPFPNVAEVTGTGDSSGDPAEEDSGTPTESTPTFTPALAFEKTGAALVDNGDGTFTTNFTLALENTGDVPLINVQITDSLAAFPSITNLLVTPTSATANPAFDGVADTNVLAAGFSLPVGGTETVTLSFSFVPDSAGPFVNTASGTGDGEFGGGGVNTPDTAEVTPALSSMLGITKTETGTVSNADGTFTSSFTIVVSNTGNEIVNDVTAVDPLTGFPSGAVLGGDPLPVNAVFAVGQMETYNVTVTFTPDSAGPFPNVAEVTGTGDSSGDPAEEDSGTPTESTPTFTPALAFEKTGAALVDNGDGTFTTNFTLALENTGDVPLINVQITDSLAAFPSITNLLVTPTSATANPAFDGVADTNVLAAGFSLPVGGTETVTLSFSFVPDSAGPFVNTASGTGDGEFGGGGVNTPDTAEVTPALSSMLGITKTETGTVSNADGTFTSSFTIVVSNTGNEIVNDVTAVDPLTGFPSGAVLGGDPLPVNAVFAVGQMETYNVTVTFTPDSAGPFPNVAEVTGTGDSSGDPAEEDSGTPTESTPTFTPALAFEKTGAALVDNGDGTFTTNFTLALENTGDVPLINVQITDSLAAFPSITNLLVTPTSATANPAFDGVADTNVLAAGFSLPVGGTETVTLSFSFVPDSAGPFVNTASGTGDGEFGGGGVNTPDTAEVTPALSSMLGITKTETGTVSNADGTFTSSFTIVVSNTGNEIVNDVTAVDPLTGFPSGAVLGGDPLPVNAVFAVGQMETYNVTVTFTPDSAGPFPNVAEVTGTGDSSGDPAEEDSGTPTESTPTFTPALAFEKTGAALVDNGDGTFTTNFTLALENTGDVPLINVQITDSLAAFPSITNLLVTPTSATANPAFDGVADTNVLAAGFSLPVGGTETVTLSFSFVPDSAGPFVNTASGTGDGEFGGGGVNTPSTATVSPALLPQIEITKNAPMPPKHVGDGKFAVLYIIELKNTGNEPLKDIEVLDDLSDFPLGATARVVTFSGIEANVAYDGSNAIIENGTLAIGAEAVVTIEVTFTPDDAVAVANNAFASANGANSDLPTEAETMTPAMATPTFSRSVEFTKSLVELIEMPVGTFRAVFSIAIENTGNEPLVGLTITDPLDGFPDNAFLTEDLQRPLPDALDLQVGQSESYTVSVTFVPDSNQTYTNQAEVGGAGGTTDVPFVALSDSDDPALVGPADPTRVTPTLTQKIVVSKELDASATEALGGDLFRAVYRISAMNMGNQPLDNIQIVDDLSDFGAGTVALSSDTLSTSYNPATGELLTGTDSLAVGETKELTIAITFTRTRTGAYRNSATATGEGAFTGDPVEDGTDQPVEYTPSNQKVLTYEDFLATIDEDDDDIYGSIFEYATCLDPNSGDNKKAFCLQYNPATGAFDADFLRRVGGLTDVTYTLEGLDDLADAPDGWRPLDSNLDLNLSGNLPSNVTITPAGAEGFDAERITYSGVQTKAEFVRLTVTLNATGEQQHSQVFGHSLLNLDPECQTFSNPFLAKECFSGTVTSQTGSVLTLSSDLPDLVALGGSLYLDVLDGEFEGHRFEIVEFASQGRNLVLVDSDSLNTLDAVPAPTGLMDSLVAIRIHRTLADIAPPEFFQADSDPTVGEDETRALIYQNGALETYFVNDTAPAATWSAMGDASGSDAGDLIIDPCQGIFLHSLSGPVFRFPSVGVVRQWNVACPLDAGYNLIGAVYPIDQTPIGRGMLDMSNGFTGTSNPGTADQLHFWRGDIDPNERNERIREGYDSYFYAKVGPLDQWVIQADSNLVNENDVSLFPMNRAVFYDKIEPQLWIRPLPWNPTAR